MAVGVSYYGKDTVLWANTLVGLQFLPKSLNLDLSIYYRVVFSLFAQLPLTENKHVITEKDNSFSSILEKSTPASSQLKSTFIVYPCCLLILHTSLVHCCLQTVPCFKTVNSPSMPY